MSQWLCKKSISIVVATVVMLTVGLYISLFHFKKLPAKTNIIAQFFNLPISFERNVGQTDPSVKYLARGQGYTLYFTPQEIVIVLKQHQENVPPSVLKMQFIGTQPAPILNGEQELPGTSNYFIGNDPEQWHTNITNYAKVVYKDLYPGIDTVFYGTSQQLEYDICIAPGKNPENIQFLIEGASKLALTGSGGLQILTQDNQEVYMQKPLIYQMDHKNKIPIDGAYIILAQNQIGFTLGAYDINKTLIIDPILSYSTYLGGNGSDDGLGITVDSGGNAYVTGQTTSRNFPTTPGVYQSTFPNSKPTPNVCVFITKLSPFGGSLVYSTYLSGNQDASDGGNSIAVDSSGNAYVTGYTGSTDFPTTPGAYQSTFPSLKPPGVACAFITKLSPSGGSLIYSTYLSGNQDATDSGNSIALDSSGNAYVTGYTTSTDFPTTPGAYQSTCPSLKPLGAASVFITKLSPSGESLVYSTYLSGNQNANDSGSGIDVDSSGNAYVTGYTGSTDFPTTPGAYQSTFPSLKPLGVICAFITKLSPSGGSLIYSTYLSGNQDESDSGNSIAVDSSGNAYVTGYTYSSDFPTTPGAYQSTFPSLKPLGAACAFITKLSPSGESLVYSTYLSGNQNAGDVGSGIAVDSSGNAYVTGYTDSTDFPTTPGAYQSTFPSMKPVGYGCAFITTLSPSGGSLVYSTYLGGNGFDDGLGIAVDSSGNAYVTGATTSTNFPTTPGAYQTSLAGNQNVFIAKFEFAPQPAQCIGGYQKRDRFLTQTDLYNTITWCASPTPSVVKYNIYRNGTLIGTVQATEVLKYEDHNRRKKVTDVYTVQAVNTDGLLSTGVTIALP